MAKKDFTNINTEDIYSNAIAEAIADPKEQKPRKDRKTYTDEEMAKYLAECSTSGRKGLRLPRLNLAVTPEIQAYVKTMARVRGETITQFVVHTLKDDLERNRELYEEALSFKERTKER